MTLIHSRKKRMVLLCALYCAQGVPRGFMTVTLISYLASKGVADETVGRLSALIALPWALKFLWAPILDSVTLRALGRRRPWVVLAQMMMAATMLGFVLLYDPAQDLAWISWVLFAHNCFAALQDVASDALAIDIVPESELGAANGLMMASKAAGVGFGAAGLALVMSRLGFHSAVAVQVVFLCGVMMLPLLWIERPGERRFPWSRSGGARLGLEIVHPRALMNDVRRALAVRSIVALAAFGFTAAVSEWLVDVINKPFYIKVLGWSYVKFSAYSGTFLIVQVVGALAGAWVADRIGWRRTLILGLVGYGILALTFGAASGLWLRAWFPSLFLMLAPALNSFGSVGFFTVAMRVSWTRSAVTIFSLMMAATSSGHVVGGWLIGLLRGGMRLDYGTIYCIGGALMLVSLLFLTLVDPAETDEKIRIAASPLVTTD